MLQVLWNQNGNLHTFESLYDDFVFKNTLLRKLKTLEAIKIIVKYVIKYGLPLRYNLNTWLPKQTNYMKLKYIDHQFGLGFNLRTKNRMRVVKTKCEKEWPILKEMFLMISRVAFLLFATPFLARYVKLLNKVFVDLFFHNLKDK